MPDLNVLPNLIVSLPGFTLYALCSVVLILKMYAIGAYTASVRGQNKVTLNKEDAGQNGTQLVDTEHPDVQRVLRAHRNDMENIVPFLVLGLLAVLSGAPLIGMRIAFIAFTVARLAHSLFYLKGIQPWRSMSFGTGALSNLALMIMIAIRALS